MLGSFTHRKKRSISGGDTSAAKRRYLASTVVGSRASDSSSQFSATRLRDNYVRSGSLASLGRLGKNQAVVKATRGGAKKGNTVKPPVAKFAPRKPRSAVRSIPKRPLCYFKLAQNAFGTTKRMESLPCRDDYSSRLHKFFSDRIRTRQAGSLFVSGAPGCGKTAVMTKLVEDLRVEYGSKVEIAVVNGITIEKNSRLFGATLQKFGRDDDTDEAVNKATLMDMVMPAKRMRRKSYVLVIDEIDGLLQSRSKSSILEQVFEWTSREAHPNSVLIVAGIANTIDLLHRSLPHLRTSGDSAPTQVNFQRYTKDEIISILRHRLADVPVPPKTKPSPTPESLDSLDSLDSAAADPAESRAECKEVDNLILDDDALRFCASSVISSKGGDLRAALQMCRSVLEKAAPRFCKRPADLRLGGSCCLWTGTAIPFTAFLSGRKANFIDAMKTLPMLGKVLLYVAGERHQACEGKATVGMVRKDFRHACKLLNNSGSTEFRSLVQNLGDLGLISIGSVVTHGPTHKFKDSAKVQIKVPREDITYALKDDAFVARLRNMFGTRV